MQDLNHYLSYLKRSRTLPGDLKLDRVNAFLKALGNPHHSLPPVVHVAGTNGKGSTIAFLKAIFKAAGYRPHVYTSPHLLHLHERFVLSGEEVSDALLFSHFQACETVLGDLPISWFEFLTASAFKLFAETPGNVVLLETGLGGRLDATNVISNPCLSIITPVSYDHQEQLGNTLPEIAGEKAGILKKGVPAVIAPQYPEVFLKLTQKIEELSCPSFSSPTDWRFTLLKKDFRFEMKGEDSILLSLPSLRGEHQILNASTAIAAIRVLKNLFVISDSALREGVMQASWPGRLQILEKHPLNKILKERELWIDGAHNEDGVAVLTHFFKDQPRKPTWVVFSCLKGKRGEKMIEHLESFADALFFTRMRGMDEVFAPCDLQKFASRGSPFPSLEDCLSALLKTPPEARVIFCGSLYFIAEVLGYPTTSGEKDR